MWKREFHYQDSWSICFYIKDEMPIMIFEKKITTWQEDSGYIANVFSTCGDHMYLQYDKDLEVLKLKCLLRAKELGWKIKNII